MKVECAQFNVLSLYSEDLKYWLSASYIKISKRTHRRLDLLAVSGNWIGRLLENAFGVLHVDRLKPKDSLPYIIPSASCILTVHALYHDDINSAHIKHTSLESTPLMIYHDINHKRSWFISYALSFLVRAHSVNDMNLMMKNFEHGED